MRTVVIGDEGKKWTDHPRDLTPAEASQIKAVDYLEGVKLHRQFTNSTLAAAVCIVRSLQTK